MTGGYSYGGAMEEALVGHVRCPTDEQHLATQRQALLALSAEPDRPDIDYRLRGRVAYGRGAVSLALVAAPIAWASGSDSHTPLT